MKELEIDTSKTTRVEVIDETGRVYTNYSCKEVVIDIQDEGRTVKVFLKNKEKA